MKVKSTDKHEAISKEKEPTSYSDMNLTNSITDSYQFMYLFKNLKYL